MQGTRFRHAAKFLRWRPDKRPQDCRYDQLEVTPAYRAEQRHASEWYPRRESQEPFRSVGWALLAVPGCSISRTRQRNRLVRHREINRNETNKTKEMPRPSSQFCANARTQLSLSTT